MFANIWYWRLAIFECLSDAYVAGAMVFMAAIADKEWSEISHTGKLIIYISTSVAVIKVIKSFLSTTIQVLKDSKPKEGKRVTGEISVVESTPEKTVETVQKTSEINKPNT